jgi:hypothetical protein
VEVRIDQQRYDDDERIEQESVQIWFSDIRPVRGQPQYDKPQADDNADPVEDGDERLFRLVQIGQVPVRESNQRIGEGQSKGEEEDENCKAKGIAPGNSFAGLLSAAAILSHDHFAPAVGA